MEVLNQTLSASFVILFVLLARLALRRAPKKFSYALWAVVLVRLLVPISIESPVSLVPVRREVFTKELVYERIPRVESGSAVVDAVINPLLPPVTSEAASVNPIQILLAVAWNLWLVGLLAIVIWSVVKLMLLLRRLRGATRLEGSIYVSDRIGTPFVIGLVRPRIYLPSTLSERERGYILEHERTHLRRFDHIVRIVAFGALVIHWFNPLVWIAFRYAMRDMEMSCDEAVLAKLGDIRADYGESLLSLTVGRTPYSPTPLAFGEGDTKGRILNIVKYKPPKKVVVIVAAVVTVAFAILLMLGLGDKKNEVEVGFTRYDGEPFKVRMELPEGWAVSSSRNTISIVPSDGADSLAFGEKFALDDFDESDCFGVGEYEFREFGDVKAGWQTVYPDGYEEYQPTFFEAKIAVKSEKFDSVVCFEFDMSAEELTKEIFFEIAESVELVDYPDYVPSGEVDYDTVELGFGFGEDVQVALVMPKAWMYDASSAPETLMTLFEQSVALSKDGEYAGYIGYSTYEEYEGFEETDFSDDDEVAAYAGMAFCMLRANHYNFIASPESLTPIFRLGRDQFVFHTTIYRQRAVEGEPAAAWPSDELDGLLVLDVERKCYVGIEFEPGTVTEEELREIAASIVLESNRAPAATSEMGFAFDENKVALAMPQGWTYDASAETKAMMELFDYTVALKKDGEYAGYIGFSTYEEYEGFDVGDLDDPTSYEAQKYAEMAISRLRMPPHYNWANGESYIDGKNDLIAASRSGDRLIYYPTIYRQNPNGDSAAAWPHELLDGIIVLDVAHKCYVGIELEPGAVTPDELREIAASVVVEVEKEPASEMSFAFDDRRVALAMPENWNYDVNSEPAIMMPLFDYTVSLKKDGEYAGYVGFNRYEEPQELADTDFSDLESDAVLTYTATAIRRLFQHAHYYWANDEASRRPVFLSGDRLGCVVEIYRQKPDESSVSGWTEDYLDGIVVLDVANKCYVGIELEPGTVTPDELREIAASVVIE